MQTDGEKTGVRDVSGPIRTKLLSGFDDPTIGAEKWASLLHQGETDVVFLSWDWMRAWWDSFGKGELLLIAAMRDQDVVALAPFYTEAGMVYFVASGYEAYYLNFVGDISDPKVLDALLQTARDCVDNFVGFEFYWVPGQSRTANYLKQSAARMKLSIHEMWSVPSPSLDLVSDPEVALAKTRKKSLMRHERGLQRAGALEAMHFRDSASVLSQLPAFFEQHISRWAAKAKKSGFLGETKRGFYEQLTRVGGEQGWLRFTRIDWNGRPIAFHFGFCYRGHYQWYRPSFDIELARMSPGEVLIRQVMLAAIEEGAQTFDMGPGDQAYKLRFATHSNTVRAWGLFPL